MGTRSLLRPLIAPPRKWLAEAYYTVLVRSGRLRVLMILAHMRSGSSLLAHILNSNPEVCGFGETHLTYQSQRDFARLARTVFRSFGEMGGSDRYVMDKLLHNEHLPNDSLLRCTEVRTVFLVREPRESLASLCKLRLRPTWKQDLQGGSVPDACQERVNLREEEALEHYVRRLEGLKRCARTLTRDHAFFLTYGQLLQKTDFVLDKLSRFLGLQLPLSERYETHWATGLPGKGDTSPRIRAGRVLRTENRHDVDLSEAALVRARRAFRRCTATLSERCTHVPLEEGSGLASLCAE